MSGGPKARYDPRPGPENVNRFQRFPPMVARNGSTKLGPAPWWSTAALFTRHVFRDWNLAVRSGLTTPARQPGSGNGAAGNTRLTAALGALLLLLFAVEGFTILRVRALLTVHVVVGALLLPPVLVKTGSTAYRMVRYYTRSPEYRRKGPPPMVLRLLGPFVVVLTVEILATGVALLYVTGSPWRQGLFFLHKAGFLVWLGAMTVHVLGHLTETLRESWRDWFPGARRIQGAPLRRWLIAGALAIGGALAIVLAGHLGQYTNDAPLRLGHHHDHGIRG